jgi:hypothetical protein
MPELAVNETRINEVAVSFEGEMQTIRNYLSELRSLPVGLTKARVAKEYDAYAKQVLASIDRSEGSTITRFLFNLHKKAVLTMKSLSAGPEELRRECGRALVQWENERRRQADEERRKREREAAEQQAKARAEEVEHLKTLGKVEEAQVVEQRPAPPISLPDAKDPVGKVEGFALIDVWVLDDENPVSDFSATLKFLSENPAFHHLVKLQPGEVKKTATQNRGALAIPGLNIVKKQESRTRGE